MNSSRFMSFNLPAGEGDSLHIFIKPPESSKRISRDLVIICIFRVANEYEKEIALLFSFGSFGHPLLDARPVRPLFPPSFLFFCRPMPLSKSF